MKDSEEYRRDLLNKVKQDPIHLETDGEMWEKVLGRISEKQPTKKNHFIWYASAAAILMCLIAGASVYFMSKPTAQVAVTNPSGKSIPNPAQDKKIIKESEKINPSNDPKKDSPEKKSNKEVYQAVTSHKEIEVTTEKELFSQLLSDGSTVTLNSFTRLHTTKTHGADFTSNLSGEAYFEVKHDTKRSFKVNFGNSYLMVVGTKFNVRNVEGESYQQVAVTEGIVKVYPNKSEKGIEVKSGELLKISLNKNTNQLSKIDPLHYIEWKTGKLSFKKTQMTEVASALERVYKIKVLVDSIVKECTFTGDLSQTPLEEALQIIEATTSLKIKRTKDNVHISGSPCN